MASLNGSDDLKLQIFPKQAELINFKSKIQEALLLRLSIIIHLKACQLPNCTVFNFSVQFLLYHLINTV